MRLHAPRWLTAPEASCVAAAWPADGEHPVHERTSEIVDPEDGLYAALSKLTPKRRIAVALRYFEDRSEAETAALMGCGVGTVKSLVSRALADLRIEMSK